MKTANIATAKNQLSRLIKQVKRGETIVITDRQHPVACLRPVGRTEDAIGRLQAIGLLTPPRGDALKVRAFLAAPRAKLAANTSLTAAVIAERQEGR